MLVYLLIPDHRQLVDQVVFHLAETLQAEQALLLLEEAVDLPAQVEQQRSVEPRAMEADLLQAEPIIEVVQAAQVGLLLDQ